MQLSKAEQSVIDQWAPFHHQGEDVVVTYETPDGRASVVFRQITDKDALLQAWDQYCSGDFEARVIREVMYCHRVATNTVVTDPMCVSKPEQAVIDRWARVAHQPGDVVVIYDILWAPSEKLESVVFHHIAGQDALIQAWDRYCDGDPNNAAIREVMWYSNVVSQ